MAAQCTIAADSWMTNQKGQSPCVVAGILRTPCGGPNFTATPLANGSHYIPGNSSSTTNPPDQCGCSWAWYNIIMACTICQTVNGAVDVLTWPNWMLLCGSAQLTNNTWFPPLYQIPTDTSVPHWAIQDPSKWTDERFDPTAAEAIASQNLPDATNSSLSAPSPTPSPTSSKKSTPIGAIVGGVIGGLFVLAIIIFLFWYSRYKNRKLKTFRMPNIPLMPSNGHARSFSGGMKPTPSPGAIVVGHDGGSPNTTWRSTTTDNHNGRPAHHHQISNGSASEGGVAMGVMSPTLVGHGNGITGPLAHQRQISAESASTLPSGMGREAMITPWYPPEHGLSPSSNSNGNGSTPPPGPESAAARKAREAGLGRASPSQSSLTTSNNHAVSTPGASGGRRMNPPAYDESLIASPTQSRPPHNRTISNESTADISSIAGSNSASAPYPTPTEYNPAASNSPIDSPAAASSAAFPPGLNGRGPLRSVTENRDQPDYFGPSAWKRDTKERID